MGGRLSGEHCIYYKVSSAVTGVLNILTSIITFGETAATDKSVLDCCKFLNFVAGIASCAWFITGNVWIFSNMYPNFDDSGADNFCDEVVYMFGMVYIIGVYVFICMAIILACCCGCVGLCCGACFICARIAAKIEAEENKNRTISIESVKVTDP